MRALPLVLATLRRLAGSLGLLVGASFIIYMMVRMAPGDVIDAISPMGTPPEMKAQLAAEFGLDRDPVTGYFAWLSRSAVGDFGESLAFSPGESVMAVALPAFKRTLMLCALTLLAGLALGLGLAVLMGEPGPRQQIFTGPAYVLTAAPSFVVAVLFAQGMNWFIHLFVADGSYEPPIWYPIPIYADSLMPYVFAGFSMLAGDGLFMDWFNTLRAELLSLKQSQFIIAVRAKGARTFGHIVKNLWVPVISSFAARLPLVLGSVVIVEYIFTLDGAGYVLLEASRLRDFPMVVGLSVLFTATVIAVSLAADLVRALVDPREVSRGG